MSKFPMKVQFIRPGTFPATYDEHQIQLQRDEAKHALLDLKCLRKHIIPPHADRVNELIESIECIINDLDLMLHFVTQGVKQN